MKRVVIVVTGLLVGLAVLLGVAIAIVFVIDPGGLDTRPGPLTTESGTYALSLEHEGRNRKYLVHLPPGADNGAPLPLVISLHPYAGKPARTDDRDFISYAERDRVVVAYPEGIRRAWNDSVGSGTDDLGFIRAMLDAIETALPIDSSRIYVSGMSNGAAMANLVACEMSDRIAGLALVAGAPRDGFEGECRPAHPIATIVFLNTKDPLFPYSGKRAKVPLIKRVQSASPAELMSFWAVTNGCSIQPLPGEALPDVTAADNSRVVVERYTGCRAGAEVLLYRIEGAGHTWPGGTQYLPPFVVGTTNRDINASELIWQFFFNRQLPRS